MTTTDYPTPTVPGFTKTAFGGTSIDLLDLLDDAVEHVDNVAESRVYAGLFYLAVNLGLIKAPK